MPISVPNVRKLKSKDYLESLTDGSVTGVWLIPLTTWLSNPDTDPDDFFAEVVTTPIVELFPWEDPKFNPAFLTWFTYYIWEQARLCGRGDSHGLEIVFEQWLIANPITSLGHFPTNRDILSACDIPRKLIANLASNVWRTAISY